MKLLQTGLISELKGLDRVTNWMILILNESKSHAEIAEKKNGVDRTKDLNQRGPY